MNEISQQTENTVNPTATQDTTASAPSVTDLDGLSEFVFQGEKYTPDLLLERLNEHKKLSETARSRAEREEFDKHFEADRVKLLKDPSLADQFRQKYPKDYHWILEFLPQGQRQETAQPNAAQSALPKEYLEKLEAMERELQGFKHESFQTKTQAELAKIDKITQPLFQKFELADEEAVWAKADALLSRGVKLTEKTWERLIRENHEKIEKRADQRHGAKLKEQLEKGRRASDVGPGGSAPGQAPQTPRTFAEAQEAMLKSIGAR